MAGATAVATSAGATTGDANSEITALSDTKFLVDERDGNFEPFANKTVYEVDINGASDISGLTINGKSPEALSGRTAPMRRSRRSPRPACRWRRSSRTSRSARW
ncbi:esterase-like activity of phytase family protein [Trebonia kvetii]|uniref:esterase-like activity of phytase family protein n=1 Tax=Trebonia kvetii TaxID=2480626 RepID=UPI0016528751|nr:esterase-like activity of phytase family protein [Trebonia kvetii]